MIEPINFLGAVRKRWRLIVVLAVVGAVIALFAPTSTTTRPKTLLKWQTFATVGAPASSGVILGTVTTSQILFFANTYPVRLAAVSDVGLSGNAFLYASGMFGTTVATTATGGYPPGPEAATTGTAKTPKPGNGSLVTLFAKGPTRDLAAALANAYAKELGTTLEQTAAQTSAARAATTGSGSKSTSTTATTPAAPLTGYQVIFPGTSELAHRTSVTTVSTLDSKKVRLLLGLLLGVALALVVIVARELLDRTIRRPHRAQVHTKFPVIAEIPETYPPDPSVVDVVDRPTSPASEAYRKLRMSVLFEPMAADSAPAGGSDPFADMFGVSSQQLDVYQVPEPGSRNVLLVVSTGDEPARPKVVANLAATYAEAVERVIVVSTGDLEIGPAIPTGGVLAGPVTGADIRSRMTPAGPEHVSMLSLRHFMRNSGQLVSRSKEVFDAARQVADVVIVEAPAFLRYHHAEAMVHSVDAVVAVVACGVTEAPDAKDMGDILRRLGAPVLGVVFTGEELSRAQRRVLDAGVAAAGRNHAALDATVVEDGGPTDGLGPEVDDVTGAAPELHPS